MSVYVTDVVSSGRLGPVERVLSEHSLAYTGGFDDDNHIMVNPRLAGNIILDAGMYPDLGISNTLQYVTHGRQEAPTVKSIVAKYPRTGVDFMVTMLLEFPREADYGGPAHAVVSYSLGLSNESVADTADASAPSVRIQGQKGKIQVSPPTYRPTHTRLILKGGIVEGRKWPQPGPGAGSGCIVDSVLM